MIPSFASVITFLQAGFETIGKVQVISRSTTGLSEELSELEPLLIGFANAINLLHNTLYADRGPLSQEDQKLKTCGDVM